MIITTDQGSWFWENNDAESLPDLNATEVDWPALFKRYMTVVGRNEGVWFIEQLPVNAVEAAALDAALPAEWNWRGTR